MAHKARTPPGNPDWSQRLAALRGRIGAEGLDALVVSSPSNIRYLTGFVASAGLLIVSARGGDELLLDGRYDGAARRLQAAGQLPALSIERVRGRYDEALAARLKALALARVGGEAGHVTVTAWRRWEADLGRAFQPTDGWVEELRLRKDEAELATLRRAADMLGDVVRGLPGIVKVGATERQMAWAIDGRMRSAGFEKPAFETIVAGGPNGAYPHAQPTDRPIEPGDLVVLDFGGVLDGYCVDLTRAACAAPVSPAARSLYEAVRTAQTAAILAVGPKAAVAAVDRAARDVLEARGLGEAFSHSTGHGLGLDVHEAPRLSCTEPGTTRLEAGMVVTIEPGAYVEGLGGVRLEDDVLVTPSGREVLTNMPRDLLVV